MPAKKTVKKTATKTAMKTVAQDSERYGSVSYSYDTRATYFHVYSWKYAIQVPHVILNAASAEAALEAYMSIWTAVFGRDDEITITDSSDRMVATATIKNNTVKKLKPAA